MRIAAKGAPASNSIFLYTQINLRKGLVRESEIARQLTSMLMQAHRELGILEGMTKYIAQIRYKEFVY
jgi:hypothetical protein